MKNLEELAELQAKQKANIKKEAENDLKESTKENAVPKHKGVSYKTYSNLVLKQSKKYKMPSENDLTTMMFQIGSTIMPPREKEDTRACLFCHLTGIFWNFLDFFLEFFGFFGISWNFLEFI